MNHIIWIILDSCRYDTFIEAETEQFDKIGKAEKRYSYASWTAPAHHTFLMGLVPHKSLKGTPAAEVYKQEYRRWSLRVGGKNEISFTDFVPAFSLVKKLMELGYHTVAKVSLPVLHPDAGFSRYFDEYRLMDSHNAFDQMITELRFDKKPVFYFLNLGETHYPYMTENLPHLSGLHGVLKKLSATGQDDPQGAGDAFFSEKNMNYLRQQQVRAVEYCDRLFGKILERAPRNTYYIITSDHGELFGENGFFGHGPIIHEKVFAVPFLEGSPGNFY